MNTLKSIELKRIPGENLPAACRQITYRQFGQPPGNALVVLVNHALTGNSEVAGENGWWKQVVGEGKVINTAIYTVIAFNIPGNGFGNGKLLKDKNSLTAKKVANLFWRALEELNINQLYAVIGGSLGGGISWEMALLKPRYIKHLIPIACSVRSSDWLIGNVMVQDAILAHSIFPVEDARMGAMLLYRSPDSLLAKFDHRKWKDTPKSQTEKYSETAASYEVEHWLMHHGDKLAARFSLKAYQLMNHLLKTVGADLTEDQILSFADQTTSEIHCIAIDSDYLFPEKEQLYYYHLIKKKYAGITFDRISSIHGHDAFLIEYDQLTQLLNPIFNL